MHPEIREEALVWIRIVRHDGPRRRLRSTTTVRNQANSAIPFLLACSQRYRTLRQVSRADVTEWLGQCAAPHTEAVAPRDMFKTLTSERLLFANPARGVSLGSRPSSVLMPLSPETIQRLTAAAETNPALKLLIALVGIHALYPHQARALPLTASDFTRGRLTLGNIDHPLDAFTQQAAVDYIHLRHQRWPYPQPSRVHQLADRARPGPGHNRLDAASAARPPGHRPATSRGPNPRRGRRHRR
ncbi:hypothetical protein [Streptomyces sp. NPDC058295]|uniref:hypothetical protein n=1 Tax=Streptomyces sp. NPDC058295 TaxID=3346431 RepID=UPI0036E0750D